MRIIIILILFLFSFNCYAKETPDSLISNLFDFLIMKGELPKELNQDKKGDSDFFYIQDVLGVGKNYSQEYGVFKFLCKYNEESHYNVFIKKGKAIEIYDISDISYLITKIITLSHEFPNLFDNSKTIKYINEVIILYNNACKTNLKNASVEFKFGNYTYSISLENYKQSNSKK